jgi:glycine oxidase
VVNEGFRYLVPRIDGHLIVGATVEDVGFDSRTTEDAIDELREYSCQLVPALRNETVKQTWAGLRPKTPDGIPFMGRVPGYTNLSVATGHYRSGLHLSPATAVFMRQLLLDDKTDIDPAVFRLNR